MSRPTDWGVLFDVDGTMVDNRDHHRRAWIEFGKRNNFPITPQFYSQNIHSRSNDHTARFLYGKDCGDTVIAAVADEKESLYRELYRPHLKAMPGLKALLETLGAAGIPCAVVSNSPHPNIDLVLDGLGIRDYFKVVLSFTDVANGKPHPDLYLAAARGIGLPVKRCVIIEDSPSGFAAAEAAGAPYVVITTGADPEHLHKSAGAATQCKDFTGLTPGILRALVE